MESRHRVLILCSSLKEAEEFTRHVSSKNYPMMQFIYPPSLTQQRMSMDELVADCRALMKEECYDATIVVQPGLELVQVTLATEFPKLASSSLESVFLCLNRLYSYEAILYGFAPHHTSLDLEESDLKNSGFFVANILENMESGCFVVPPYTLNREKPLVIETARQFTKDICQVQEVVKLSCATVAEILKAGLSISKYERALSMTCCFVEQRPLNSTSHLVEGCVVDEEYIPIFIVDVLHWPDRPHSVQALSLPSQLVENSQYQIWATMREVAQRLVSNGFNNQVLRADVFVTEEGNVKVVELSSSVDVANIKAYKHVYTDGDILLSSMKVALGRPPHRPKLLPHRHSLLVHLTAFASQPFTAGEVFNFGVDRSDANINIHMKDSTQLTGDQYYGDVVGSVTVTERSYASCFRKASSMVKQLLNEGSNSPWLDNDFNDLESLTTESVVGTPRFDSRPTSELSVALPNIMSSRRSSANPSPKEGPDGFSTIKTPESPEFPRRAGSSSLTPLAEGHRRQNSLSPRRLSPILSANHNGHSRANSRPRRQSHRLSPMSTSITPLSLSNPFLDDSQDGRSRLTVVKPRDLTPVPSSPRGRRLSLSTLDPSPSSLLESSDMQLAKTVAKHNRRRSITLTMNPLERAQHIRRLSDAAAFSTIKLPSLTLNSSFDNGTDVE